MDSSAHIGGCFLANMKLLLPAGVNATLLIALRLRRLLACEPDVVIHAAAMTNIDECENEPIKALAANRDTTYNIVELLSYNAKFVYISTDMVYSDIPGPHREKMTWGRSICTARVKLAGEKSAAINPRHLILRTNFFGPSQVPWRQSLSDWVLQSLTDGSTPIFYNDVWWSPLHIKTLSQTILELVEANVVGIYNLGARTGLSKSQFALQVAEHKGLYDRYKMCCGGTG